MSPLEEKILILIKRNPGCTYRDIELFTGSAHRIIVIYKNHLVDRGLIKEKIIFPGNCPLQKTFYPRGKK